MVALLSALTVMGNLISVPMLPIQAGTGMVILSGVAFGPLVGFTVGMTARFVSNFFQGQGSWTLWQMLTWGLLGALSGVSFHGASVEKPKERTVKPLLEPVCVLLAFEIAAYLSYLLFPMGEESFWGWRVYAFGAAGLFVGMLLQKQRLPVGDISLTVFTFFTVCILYGGIMNLSVVFTAAPSRATMTAETLKTLYITGFPFDLWHGIRASIFMFLFGERFIRKLERIKIKYGFYRIHRTS